MQTANLPCAPQEPLVSVVTPCFNGEAHLDYFFDGLLSQTYRNAEIIFVDDGSKDGTADAFARYAERLRSHFAGDVLYLAQSNQGACAAVNTALSRVHGEIVVPCDSDDFMLPNKLRDHVEGFRLHPDADLVYGNVYICQSPYDVPTVSALAEFQPVPQGPAVYELLLSRGMFIRSCAYAFRYSALSYLQNGRLDQGDPGQNLDLLLRIAHRGKVVHHPTHVAKQIMRPGSASRGSVAGRMRYAVGSRRIVDRVIAELGCSADVRRAVERRYTPREVMHYMLTNDGASVRRCIVRALRAGVYSRGLAAAWISSWTAAGRSRYVADRLPPS